MATIVRQHYQRSIVQREWILSEERYLQFVVWTQL